MSDVLKVDNLKEGVSILTLNRPEVLNSLNKELIDSLLTAFDDIYENNSIRSVIITGEGRGFCSGADLAGGGWPSDPKWSQGESTANAMEIGFNPLVRKIVECPKPVVIAQPIIALTSCGISFGTRVQRFSLTTEYCEKVVTHPALTVLSPHMYFGGSD